MHPYSTFFSSRSRDGMEIKTESCCCFGAAKIVIGGATWVVVNDSTMWISVGDAAKI